MNFYSGAVSVIDTAANTVVANVPVGNFPSWVAVTPDGEHAYVTNLNGYTSSNLGDRHGHKHSGGHGPGGG